MVRLELETRVGVILFVEIQVLLGNRSPVMILKRTCSILGPIMSDICGKILLVVGDFCRRTRKRKKDLFLV